jgi:hypothetical protein
MDIKNIKLEFDDSKDYNFWRKLLHYKDELESRKQDIYHRLIEIDRDIWAVMRVNELLNEKDIAHKKRISKLVKSI